jgi:hypothetical protein
MYGRPWHGTLTNHTGEVLLVRQAGDGDATTLGPDVVGRPLVGCCNFKASNLHRKCLFSALETKTLTTCPSLRGQQGRD